MTELSAARRHILLAMLAAAALPEPVRADAGCDPPRVLLVCPAGTVKSAIAREVLRRRARERGVAVRVASRGVKPEDHVSPGLAARLQADGLDVRAEPVRRFDPADLRDADVVIAFDEAANEPALKAARVWDTPSWNTDYDAAAAALRPRVEALLDELSPHSCRPR